MKLPEFTASKRMSLNMTSSRATADRSAEFQAKGALTGKINQFSEALEQKRRAANVQTFKRDENISTMEDWTDAKNIINKSKRLDGSFDFKLAQDYDTEKRHNWEGIQETIGTDKSVGFDEVVGQWWKGRVHNGLGNANNSDQASAYMNSISEVQLSNTVKAQNAYNIERAEYSTTSLKRYSDSVVKTLTAENSLLDVSKFKTAYKNVESEIMGDVNINALQKKNLIDSTRNTYAVKLLDAVNRVVVEEAEKGNKGSPKVKEAVLYGMQFIKGMNIGNKKATAIVTKDGKEIIPKGRKRKGSEELQDKMSQKEPATKPDIYNTPPKVAALIEKFNKEFEPKTIDELAEEGMISVDIDAPVSALAEKYHALKDLKPEDISEKAKVDTADMINADGSEKITNIDAISVVGENLFSQSLTPEQHSEWLMKLTKWGFDYNVQSSLTGLKTAQDLLKVVAAGRDTKKSNEALNQIMTKLTDPNNKDISQDTKIGLTKQAWLSSTEGAIMNNIAQMTPKAFNDSMNNMDSIVEAQRQDLISKYPKLAEWLPEGALQKDTNDLRDKLVRERATVLKGIRTNAAAYLLGTGDKYVTAAHGSVEVSLKNGDMRGAKIAINNFRDTVRERARTLGVKNNISTVPPVVSQNYAERLSSSSDIMQDPKGLATGKTLSELKSILGGGREYMTGIKEIIELGEKSGLLGDGTEEYKNALWVTSMTNDPATARDAIQLYRAKKEGLWKKWDEELGVDGKKAAEANVQSFVSDTYKEAMLGFDGADDLASQKRYYAFKEYLTAKVKNKAANGVKQTSWYNFFSKKFISQTAGSVDVEDLGRKASRTMVGLSISDGKNAIMIPNSVIETYKSSPVQNRVEGFLDSMNNDKREEFVNKYYSDAALFNLVGVNSQGESATQIVGAKAVAAQRLVKNIFSKEAQVMPDRIKKATPKEQMKFLAEKVRYKMAQELVFRGNDSGMVLMYKSNGDNGDLKFNTVINPTTGDDLLIPWDTVIHRSSVDGFDPFKK